jgi:hypothetical protein
MPSLKSFFFLARVVPQTRSLSHYPPPSTRYSGTRATQSRHLGLKISPRAHCLNAVADNHFSRATLIPVNFLTKFTCSAGWREESKCRKQFHFKEHRNVSASGVRCQSAFQPHSAFPLPLHQGEETPYRDVEEVTENFVSRCNKVRLIY